MLGDGTWIPPLAPPAGAALCCMLKMQPVCLVDAAETQMLPVNYRGQQWHTWFLHGHTYCAPTADRTICVGLLGHLKKKVLKLCMWVGTGEKVQSYWMWIIVSSNISKWQTFDFLSDLGIGTFQPTCERLTSRIWTVPTGTNTWPVDNKYPPDLHDNQIKVTWLAQAREQRCAGAAKQLWLIIDFWVNGYVFLSLWGWSGSIGG